MWNHLIVSSSAGNHFFCRGIGRILEVTINRTKPSSRRDFWFTSVSLCLELYLKRLICSDFFALLALRPDWVSLAAVASVIGTEDPIFTAEMTRHQLQIDKGSYFVSSQLQLMEFPGSERSGVCSRWVWTERSEHWSRRNIKERRMVCWLKIIIKNNYHQLVAYFNQGLPHTQHSDRLPFCDDEPNIRQ